MPLLSRPATRRRFCHAAPATHPRELADAAQPRPADSARRETSPLLLALARRPSNLASRPVILFQVPTAPSIPSRRARARLAQCLTACHCSLVTSRHVFAVASYSVRPPNLCVSSPIRPSGTGEGARRPCGGFQARRPTNGDQVWIDIPTMLNLHFPACLARPTGGSEFLLSAVAGNRPGSGW
jgi:hypothetical protein